MQLNTVPKHSEMTEMPSLFTVLQTHFSHQHSEITGNDGRGRFTVGDYLEASIFIGVTWGTFKPSFQLRFILLLIARGGRSKEKGTGVINMLLINLHSSTSLFLANIPTQKLLFKKFIDDCWECDPNWPDNRQSLADCAIGFGQYALGGKGGEYYIVTDSSNDDAVNPRPGTLRYAVIQTEPLWIVFPGNMLIKLSQELIFNSCKTLDCRGANVHIVGCGCITWQYISNVIIHNVHIHHCYPSVDKLRSFLRQLPLFSNAFLVGGAEDFFIIELADQVDIFFTGQLQKLKVEPAHKTSPGLLFRILHAEADR
ncbi:unnamed protein product [Prunus armeniaca]|uniref:Pectate lyase superfamily protein domain-containing protein n=1 Tax=Prunus armeniaca TaxID=36596 RepID=A0A6J5Y8L3_PRUAR|nr:unnamed protein product [Prunus armeniaca]